MNQTTHTAGLMLSLLICSLALTGCVPGELAEDCDETEDLAEAVNAYRESRGLDPIPISSDLTRVAQAHVDDLEANAPVTGACNLHSWSSGGDWSGCCYTDDHARSACMWDKPRELTGYDGNGYEIAATSSGKECASGALQQWRSSPGHHDVILNRGPWADLRWRAMGAAVLGGYAVAWFGEEAGR